MKSMIPGTEDGECTLNPSGSLMLDLWEWEGIFPLLPLQEMKYVPIKRAFGQLPPPAKVVLDKMLEFVEHTPNMKLFVDYKVRDLKKGDCGCALDFWHLDVVENPRHPTPPDKHWLFTTEYGTDVMTTPITIYKHETTFREVVTRAQGYEWVTTTPNTITSYGRFNLHKAPRMGRDCQRVMIRLTQTEVIK